MESSTPIRFREALVVEDDPAARLRLCGLIAALDDGRIDTASVPSLADAHAALALRHFDIALIDVGLPDGNGIDLIAWLHRHKPMVTTLVISSWGDEETVLSALRAGAVGYLLKERDDVELILSLKSVQRGGAPIDPAVAKRILSHLRPAAAPATAPVEAGTLTAREVDILNLVSRGYSNREIAELTGISRFTVEDHTKRIYRKLAVRSRTEAVHEAKSAGLLR